MKMTPQPLWSGGAPGALGDESGDIPTLTAFIPEKPTGAAMIVCPGGGYNVCVEHEKDQVAERLNALGITAFVLVYRTLPNYAWPTQLLDVERAIRTVRCNAAELGIDPQRIGVIGFSAGGHLAATVSVHGGRVSPDSPDAIDQVSSRPNLAVLVYPVITLDAVMGRPGICRKLMGAEPTEELADLLSLDRQVTSETPPTFLYHRTGDPTVPVIHPLLYASALAAKGVPFELHVYDAPGHGQVWAPNSDIDRDWPERLRLWLTAHNFT